MNRFLSLVVIAALTGCGASALSTHARAASVAGVTLGTVRPVILQHFEQSLGGCQDAACISRQVEQHQAVLFSYNASRAALSTWVEAIALAHAADSQGVTTDALGRAAAGFLAAYVDMVDAGHIIELELPAVPPEVRIIVSGLAPRGDAT